MRCCAGPVASQSQRLMRSPKPVSKTVDTPARAVTLDVNPMLSGDNSPEPIPGCANLDLRAVQVLMVAPTAFTFNEQAAQDNHFMHAINSGGEVGPAAQDLHASYLHA